MAFFRNFTTETVSQSILEDKGRGQSVGRISSVGNEDVDETYGVRDFDINMDVQYQCDGELDDANRLQNEAAAVDHGGVRDLNLQPSGRRTALAGRWGSTFWKDCQPMGLNTGGSDSGQDSKSEYKIMEGSDDNSSEERDDRLESQDEGRKPAGKAQRDHSDIPAEEMMSDEYYEQDGEEQSDSKHYRGFSNSVGLNYRPQSKPVAVNNNVSRRLRGLKSPEDGNYDDDNNEDADYEDEDEEEDDTDDADFEPDYGVTSGLSGNKDWDAEGSDEDDNVDDELDVSDEDDSYSNKKPKGRQRGFKASRNVQPARERKSLYSSSQQRRGKSSFEEDKYPAEDSDSESDEDFKGMTRRGAQLRKGNARSMSTNTSGLNTEVRTSSRSVRKVSYVESDGSEEGDEGKKKKSQKDDIEEEDGDSIEKVLWHQPKGMAEDALRNSRSTHPVLLSHLFDSEPDWNEMEFLIKWKGQSHLHCQWKSFAELQNLSGFKKVLNYTKKVMEDVRFRKMVSREEIEVNDVSKEMDLDIIKQNSQVERVIADRISKDSSGNVMPEYLVKWKGLSYAEATWEKDVDIAIDQVAIDEYKAREAAMAEQGKMVDLQRKKGKDL